MMIDDEPGTILTVKKSLELAGYQNFIFATNASLALEMLHNQRLDLVLLDILMPQIDGLELLGQIRREYRLQHLPVIIFTANANQQKKREALELGANEFLAKPLDLQ